MFSECALDEFDREAMREGEAIKKIKSFTPKQRKIKTLTTGKPVKEEELDLLELLNIVH